MWYKNTRFGRFSIEIRLNIMNALGRIMNWGRSCLGKIVFSTSQILPNNKAPFSLRTILLLNLHQIEQGLYIQRPFPCNRLSNTPNSIEP